MVVYGIFVQQYDTWVCLQMGYTALIYGHFRSTFLVQRWKLQIIYSPFQREVVDQKNKRYSVDSFDTWVWVKCVRPCKTLAQTDFDWLLKPSIDLHVDCILIHFQPNFDVFFWEYQGTLSVKVCGCPRGQLLRGHAAPAAEAMSRVEYQFLIILVGDSQGLCDCILHTIILIQLYQFILL